MAFIIFISLVLIVALGGLYVACHMVYIFFREYYAAYKAMFIANMPKVKG
jgi:hypothetical protein